MVAHEQQAELDVIQSDAAASYSMPSSRRRLGRVIAASHPGSTKKYRPHTSSLEELIWSRTTVDANGCWLWHDGARPGEYGRVNLGPVGRKTTTTAHRVSYELFREPIPVGLVLDHLCRVKACVNPWHLEPVTNTENVLRGLHGDLKTHCIHGHEYTPENTIHRRGHQRRCRACSEARRKNP